MGRSEIKCLHARQVAESEGHGSALLPCATRGCREGPPGGSISVALVPRRAMSFYFDKPVTPERYTPRLLRYERCKWVPFGQPFLAYYLWVDVETGNPAPVID